MPPDHPDSNYRLAWEELLSHTAAEHVYRMRAEAEEPDQTAQEYEQTLAQAFDVKDGKPPRFDPMLLGLGEDGHVASLFPGSPALSERDRLAVAPYVPKLGSFRLSLTLPVLNNACWCFFVASGQRKRWVFSKVVEGSGQVQLPVHIVQPTSGRLIWVVDGDARGTG